MQVPAHFEHQRVSALDLALEMAHHPRLRREQARRRAGYERTGHGSATKVYPTGSAVLRMSCMSHGQGHETTFAQMVSHKLGISPAMPDVPAPDDLRWDIGNSRDGAAGPVAGISAAGVSLREIARAGRDPRAARRHAVDPCPRLAGHPGPPDPARPRDQVM